MRETTKKTLLVAEDCWITRQVLRLLLRKEFKVMEAENGQQTVELLKAKGAKIACLLLDIRMPLVDGYGVMDFMRQSGLNRQIPVIAVTSVSDPSAKARCFRSGMVDLIEKPIHLPSLMDKVHRVLAQVDSADADFQRPARAVRPTALATPAARRRKIEDYCRQMFGIENERKLASLYRGFMKAFAENVKLLEAQLAKPDFRAVRDITHDIRGFAANAGAQDLADANTVLNSVARAKDAEATVAAIRSLISLYNDYRG